MGGVVAHKTLVSAPVPLELILTRFDWVGAGPWGFGFGDGAWQQDEQFSKILVSAPVPLELIGIWVWGQAWQLRSEEEEN